MSEELKPCPFCGSEDVRTFETNDRDWYATCDGCGANTSYWSTEDEVRRRWNSRAEGQGIPYPCDKHGTRIDIGDYVWDGDVCAQAVSFTRVEDDQEWLVSYEWDVKHHISPCSNVTACPLGADGKPLLVGEAVYRKDGHRVVVAEYMPMSGEMGMIVDTSDITSYWIKPDKLTHEAPDSWEKLGEDSRLAPRDYLEARSIECGQGERIATMMADLVARAKRLAGTEGGDE